MSQLLLDGLKNKIEEKKALTVDITTDKNAISTLDKLDSEISALIEGFILDSLDTIQE